MSGAKTNATALMRQYRDVKSRYPDAIVFFRLGDFYEMFGDDAVYVAKILSLTLTTRDKDKEDPVPMCGVPHHAARAYVQKLTDLGHRVAVCEQLEDPKVARGIVRRDVVRVVTPGVTLDEESLDPRAPSYVAAVASAAREGYGLAFVDVSTGEFLATEAGSREALLDELARVVPREIVLARADAELATALRRAYPSLPQAVVSGEDEEPSAQVLARAVTLAPDRAALERAPLAARAAARVMAYAQATQVAAAPAVPRLQLYDRGDYLVIDEQARTHLELIETMEGRKREGSLLGILDATATAMGARLLRKWILFPLIDIAAIRRRQDAVAALVDNQPARDRVRAVLRDLGDIERLASRARLALATPRDLASLGRTLARLPELARALAGARRDLTTGPIVGAGSGAGAPEDEPLRLGDDLAAEIARRIVDALADDAPATARDGGFIRAGVSRELDELRAIAAGGRDRVLEIEARERQRTGIASLKVKYNDVFGYYIEVTRPHLHLVPADYTRKQTVANAERFVTAELAEYEHKILHAEERRVALEQELFAALRAAVGVAAERLFAIAARVAAVDALAAFAEVAHRNGYVRPEVDDSLAIDLDDSRHPVVERLAAAGGFVPNDLRLDAEKDQVLIVTGPNMAGKSTLIRQVALTAILAQAGSFVPARRARVGLVDRVFTRVGAGDNLARGESTFLVEMRETAHILRHATRRSLIVLDEIGRGTSTYDGVSIAWAVADHLHQVVGARTMFATHYHELCALADVRPRVRNVSVAAVEQHGEVVFLRKLQAGGASRSFGIEVARLAGLPAAVVTQARVILRDLEAGAAGPGEPAPLEPGRAAARQLSLDRRARGPHPPAAVTADAAMADAREIVEELRGVDPDALSPRAAWELVARLKKKLTPPR